MQNLRIRHLEGFVSGSSGIKAGWNGYCEVVKKGNT
jgi:hypothetical protein